MNEISDIRKLQLLELGVLKEFASVCDKHDLTYFLSEGTLLGAVRHQGFISWDDDVDVCMPREDYEVFAKIVQTELPEYMSVIYYRNSDSEKKDRSFFIHPCDNRYKVTWKMECDTDTEMLPVWIDVAPLDGLPANRILRAAQLFRMKILHEISRCSIAAQISTDRELPLWKRTGIILAKKLRLDRLNTKRCYEVFDDIAKRCPFKGSVYAINYASEYGKKAMAPTAWFGKGRMVKFEDIELRIPDEAEKILTKEYGDYLTLPPESERRSKHIVLCRSTGGVIFLRSNEDFYRAFAGPAEKEQCAA